MKIREKTLIEILKQSGIEVSTEVFDALVYNLENQPQVLEMSVAEHSHGLYKSMENMGYPKGTDKNKWREVVMAQIMNHTVHPKISAGKNSPMYGSDSFGHIEDGVVKGNEYKTMSILQKQLKNLMRLNRTLKNGKLKQYDPITITGVYNGFNSNYEQANQTYSSINHFFGVFFEEKPLLIIQVKTEYVMEVLNRNYQAWVESQNRGKVKSSNLNNVAINLGDTHLYDVIWKDDKFNIDGEYLNY